MSMTQTFVAIAVVVALAPAPARADIAAAARAFNEGQAAQLAGDYDRAAQHFELAYAIAPSVEALRSAVRARQESGQAARAATLAEILLAKYADDRDSTKLANDVIADARPRFGRLQLSCPASCTIAVDGKAITLAPSAAHVAYLPAGSRSVDVTFEGSPTVTRVVLLRAGEDARLTVERPVAVVAAPVKPPAPEPVVEVAAGPPPRGISPAFAITGAVVTLGLAGIATWSSLDTVRAHDDYVADPRKPGAWEDGRSKQLRTNLLWTGTAALGIGTVVVAVVWTRWRGAARREVRPTATANANGVGLGVVGSF